MEIFQGRSLITNVIGGDFSEADPLSSQVQYTRSILYPNKEYFILIDRLEGTQPWVYRTIFRPTSLSITPSTSTTTVGNVQGSLFFGGTAYNWLALPYNSETSTGITTGSMKWTTNNPYGDNVNLEVFTSPAAEVLVNKLVGRIGGTDMENEVYSPVVSFRSPSGNNLYRITALLSRYDSESLKTPSAPAVTGLGSAVKVHGPSSDDYIYAGTGSSSFGPFATDAGSFYARVTTRPIAYTLVGGSSLDYSGTAFLQMDAGIDYITAKEKSDRVSLYTRSGAAGATVTLSQIPQDVVGVTRDGVAYGTWTNTSDTLTFTPGLGEHQIDILWGPIPNRPPVLAIIGNRTGTAGSLISFSISATDPDADTLTYAASGLPTGAVFDATSETFSWTPSASQVGTYQVDFSVSDGSLSDHQSPTITVVAGAVVSHSVSEGGGGSGGGGAEILPVPVEQTVTAAKPPGTPAEVETVMQPVATMTGKQTIGSVPPTTPRPRVAPGRPQPGFLGIQVEFLIEMLHRSESIPGVDTGITLLKKLLHLLGW
jgi:hypothetical protein